MARLPIPITRSGYRFRGCRCSGTALPSRSILLNLCIRTRKVHSTLCQRCPTPGTGRRTQGGPRRGGRCPAGCRVGADAPLEFAAGSTPVRRGPGDQLGAFENRVAAERTPAQRGRRVLLRQLFPDARNPGRGLILARTLPPHPRGRCRSRHARLPPEPNLRCPQRFVQPRSHFFEEVRGVGRRFPLGAAPGKVPQPPSVLP